MTLRSTFSVLVLAFSSLAVGCSASSGADEGASSREVTVSGNVNRGPVTTKSFAGLAAATAGANLHVWAHEIHARGATGRSIDVAVAADGSFHVGVERGKRWLVTVDDSNGGSAIITFGNGENVLSVSADGSSSRIDVGGLQIVGGEARSALALDAALGVEATLAGLDDVFESASGAIVAAREAADEARKAADAARQAGSDAQASADEARRQAEEAAKTAGN